ncbi:MAG: efflux RND transporter periplasmic adaptor subunit [bacterium]
MKFLKKKRTIAIIAVILILLLIIFGKNKPTVEVEAMDAKIESINETVSIDGTLEPFVDVKISSDITGKCTRIYVEQGDKVKKGTPLLKIDDVSQRARLTEAETALNAAQSNFEYVSYKFENQKKLYEEKLSSLSEFTLSELEFKNAQNTLASMQAAYDIAKNNIEKTLITSPIDGIITAVYVEEGENVITGTMNNAGTVLMTVSDNNKLLVKANVDETSIVKIMKQNPTTVIFDAYPETTYTGFVYQKGNRPTQESSVSETGIEYEVQILLEEAHDELISGMTGEVNIITQVKENVLTVPIQAVVSRNGDEGVFTLNGNIISFTPVKTGITGNMKLEVISDNLKEGDKVITGPFTAIKTLQDKQKVKISEKNSKTNKNSDKLDNTPKPDGR